MKIGEREIGPGHPVYIIADVGSNHDQDLKTAVELITVANEAGIDAVKFQMFRAADLCKRRGVPLTTQHEGHDMPREWVPELKQYCDLIGIEFLCTPFDLEAVDVLDPYVNAFKIAHDESGYVDLVERAASKGKPMILSCSPQMYGSLQEAVNACGEFSPDIALLHCIANYPARSDQLSLRTMEKLSWICIGERPPRYHCQRPAIGFSDHSLGIIAPVVAVSVGACIIEKHFTLDKSQKGPDHHYALEPKELGEMVKAIREAERMLR